MEGASRNCFTNIIIVSFVPSSNSSSLYLFKTRAQLKNYRHLSLAHSALAQQNGRKNEERPNDELPVPFSPHSKLSTFFFHTFFISLLLFLASFFPIRVFFFFFSFLLVKHTHNMTNIKRTGTGTGCGTERTFFTVQLPNIIAKFFSAYVGFTVMNHVEYARRFNSLVKFMG